MSKYITIFLLVLLNFGFSYAQEANQSTKKPAESTIINKKLNYYQNESKRLSKYSKTLKSRVNSLSNANKRLTIKVENLQRDSSQLASNLEQALSNNQKIIQAYETRIKGMSNELKSIRDTINTLRAVRQDLDLIKNYISTLTLAPREYKQPYDRVVDILLQSFSRAQSPYEVNASSSQEMSLLENYKISKRAFLFFKKNSKVQAEYLLTFNPNPINTSKTLVKVQTNLYNKKGDSLTRLNDTNEKTKVENRLFGYIDKQILQYQ